MRLRLQSCCVLAWAWCLWSSVGLAGDEPKRQGPWTITTEADGTLIQTATLTVHPADQPQPALAYRFIPDDFDLVKGNAAIHYLKAMAFLEQTKERDRIWDFEEQARERHPDGEAPPHAWLGLRPDQLPLAEVKEFLANLSFQTPFLAEAARRRHCDWDRNIHDVESPFSILLSDVQSTRELARMQSLRCKVAIAERKLDDAIAIIGQQFQLARHLAEDGFLVSLLVGISNATLAIDDAMWLAQQRGAPNLFWAYAALPRPLVDLRPAEGCERKMVALTFRFLQDVDETPRPAGYWESVIERLAPALETFLDMIGADEPTARVLLGDEPAADQATRVAHVRAALLSRIDEAFPGAARYLVETCGLPRDTVDALPKAQTVLLAMKLLTERVADEEFKWCHVAFPVAAPHLKESWKDLEKETWAEGLPPFPRLFVGFIGKGPFFEARFEQLIAMLQAVEAIRMYGARHEGTLPASLDDLDRAAPVDPVSGEPFGYEVDGGVAVLSGHPFPWGDAATMLRRITIRFAAN